VKIIEYTCKYCGHKWIEKEQPLLERLSDKLGAASQDFARPLFPWTPQNKKEKRRCPKCGSEVF